MIYQVNARGFLNVLDNGEDSDDDDAAAAAGK